MFAEVSSGELGLQFLDQAPQLLWSVAAVSAHTLRSGGCSLSWSTTGQSTIQSILLFVILTSEEKFKPIKKAT